MSERLKNKVALVTGGGTGIGAAIAKRFASSGASVIVTGRRIEPIAYVANEIDGLAIQADTAKKKDCEAAIAQATETYGGLDILVANAGIIYEGSVTSQDEEEWIKTMDVNVNGMMRIARVAIPC